MSLFHYYTTCVLTLTHQGVLILRNAIKGNVLWSSANSTTLQVRNPIGQLLDTGNFIIYEEGDRINQEDPIWQSFDSLQHTLLPGEKLGWNYDTGKERHLTAWKSEDDPAFSEFSYLIDARGHPQPMITKGQEIQYRAGPWNGLRFIGAFNLKQNRIYNFTFVVDQREIYYQFKLVNTSVITMLVLQPSGHLERLLWLDNKKEWNVYLSRPIDLCDQYSVCGTFGICNIEKSPICDCLKGFEPTSPDHWRITDWSQGCRHTITLDCKPGEGFSVFGICNIENCSRTSLSSPGFSGYMAPEYAGDGIFSIKSDVYSFGVLVLEIVSGDKNRGFVHKEHCNNLIGHAWGLHNEGGSLQLVAKCLGESINVCQVLRSIHIALLCVQRHPEDRPTMTTVILMLGSESPLPSPKEPGFYVGKTKQDTTESSSSYGTSSTNELSISMLKGR
ncbi:hypothetical protein L1987_85051 [Smallanthus sonchifolius]|uniref:Uncharacterized protein n=1 Tax=Smallanthus sonchifolius TaxID=185202 RepID=A0ACB8XW16_9ASTR|nr:hypothetical protein L1987_85051 [Smallanthus sonchifolius]